MRPSRYSALALLECEISPSISSVRIMTSSSPSLSSAASYTDPLTYKACLAVRTPSARHSSTAFRAPRHVPGIGHLVGVTHALQLDVLSHVDHAFDQARRFVPAGAAHVPGQILSSSGIYFAINRRHEVFEFLVRVGQVEFVHLVSGSVWVAGPTAIRGGGRI